MKSALLLIVGSLVALAVVAIFVAGWFKRPKRRRRKTGKRVFDDLV